MRKPAAEVADEGIRRVEQLLRQTGAQFQQSGETTAQLKFAKAPFIYGMAVLCAVAGLVHLYLMVRPPANLAQGDGAAL